MSDRGKAKVIVRSGNILKAPLLETSDAYIMEFYDSYGDMHALMIKMLNDECWGLITRDDPAWPNILVRYGYLKPEAPSVEQLKLLIAGD
jgi:hypothetical protein